MNNYLTVFALVAVGVAQLASAQMIKQCKCDDITPCKENYLNALEPCMDSCQSHASQLGADYGKLKSCLMALEPNLRQTIACTENKHSDSCARGAPKQVQKRYPETLRIAALTEINRMLSRSGVANDVKGLLAQGKKVFGCMQSCMTRKAGNCEKKLGCGLQLPGDAELVQNTKQCAIQSGVNTPAVQKMCKCAVDAGVKQLSGVCDRLVVT